MATRLRRIVCYAINGSGLGHVTRLTAIARWLRRYGAVLEGRVPEVIFLSSSEASEILLRAGFASFKLPSKTVVRASGMDMLEYRRLAKQFVWQMLGLFSPDLFVVDTFPSGSFDELLQVLDGPFRKALVLRRVKPDYAERSVFTAATGLYDHVVVPHTASRDVFVPPSARRVTFSGPIVQIEREGLASRDAVRDELGIPRDAPLVYLSAGGGGDPGSERVLETALDVLRDDPRQPHVLVGAGPLYTGRRHDGDRVRWCERIGIARWLGGCDAAISAGGYNTFHELVHLGVPTVFFAQPKVADDQLERIRHAAVDHAACLTWPDVTEPDGLRDALDVLLGQPERAAALADAARAMVPDSGARRAAEAMLSGFYPAERLTWARHAVSSPLAEAFERHGIAAGGSAMATWLPALLDLPPGLDSHPGFDDLVARLSPEAAGEVRAALDEAHDTAALDALQGRLADLVDAAHALPGGLEAVLRTLKTALKKHPLDQESRQQSRQAWLGEVVELVHGLLVERAAPCAETTGPLPQAARLQLYRIYPRIVDAPLAEAAALFAESCARLVDARIEPFDAVQRIRALKFTHKRVTRSVMARFHEELQP